MRSMVGAWKVLGLTCALALVVGCGGGSSPTSPSVITPAAGSWAGTTSENLPVSFTLTGGGALTVTNLRIGLKLSTNNGPLQSYTCRGSADVAVANGAFTANADCVWLLGVPIVTVPVKGTFTSSTAVNGTVSSSTWSATKS